MCRRESTHSNRPGASADLASSSIKCIRPKAHRSSLKTSSDAIEDAGTDTSVVDGNSNTNLSGTSETAEAALARRRRRRQLGKDREGSSRGGMERGLASGGGRGESIH